MIQDASIELSAIRWDASAILRKSRMVVIHTRILRSIPAWPTEAEATLELARAQAVEAVEALDAALAEFDAKPVDLPKIIQSATISDLVGA